MLRAMRAPAGGVVIAVGSGPSSARALHALFTCCSLQVPHTAMSAYRLPPSLSEHLLHAFARALPRAALHELPSRLVDELSQLAVEVADDDSDAARNAWAHREGRRAARTISKDADMANRLMAGEADLAAVLAAAAERSRQAGVMFETITSRHKRLRIAAEADDAGSFGVSPEVWADARELEQYAGAAAQIGSREWVRLGIAWCADQADHFFRRGGGLKLETKDASRRSWDERGRALSTEESTAMRQALQQIYPRDDPRPVRLLDVGSCGSMFDEFRGLHVTALDLQPNARSVLQCDFLKLKVSAPGSEAVVDDYAEFAAGCLRSLPAAGFDVVVMSLVLSYLPLPTLRAEMVVKARELLPPAGDAVVADGQPQRRGLLLIVETLSVDKKAKCWADQVFLHKWVSAVERLGFRFLRHERLQRSHALAFATEPRQSASPAGGDCELPMRSERPRSVAGETLGGDRAGGAD